MTTYKIYLRDVDSDIVARFHGAGRGLTGGGLQSIRYFRSLRAQEDYRLEIAGDDERLDLFELDGQVEILRNDPAWVVNGNPSGWVRDFEGFHRQPSYRQDEAGNLLFGSTGQGYGVLMASETIHWPAGQDETCKNGPAETVLKEYVEENIGSSAGLDENGLSRVRQWLTVEATGGGGATWTGCRSEKLLHDVAVELAEYGPGDYRIVNNNSVENESGPAAFQFQWRNDRWGEDKTRGASPSHPDGPIVFSASGAATNITNLSLLEPYAGDTNVVYGLGWGLGTSRLRRTVNSASATSTPWSRRAVSRDARDLGDPTALIDRIQDVLDKSRTRVELSFVALQTASTRYLRDWDLGDLVTFELKPGTEYDLKVVGIEPMMEQDGRETITAFLAQE